MVKHMERKKTAKKPNIKALALTAVMGALGTVLMLLEFSIPVMPAFVKLDFSELPALIASFAYGPAYGVLVCLIKNLLHIFFGSTMCVGEASNFILGAIFAGTAGIIYRKMKSKKGALISCTAGAAAMAVISIFTNYFVVYPLFSLVLGMPQEAILGMYQAILPSTDNLFEALVIFNLPFNFFKGMADTIMCFLIYKRISPLLKSN